MENRFQMHLEGVTKLERGGADSDSRLSARIAGDTIDASCHQESVPVRTTRRENGFTLIELMIVVSISLIIAGFAIPQFMAALRSYRIAGNARDINGEILLAKMRAAANFTWYRVMFDEDDNTFVSQMWCKTATAPCTAANDWQSVSVGGPQHLATGVTFGFGAQTAPPAGTQTGSGLALPPTCKTARLGATDEAGNKRCITFNSRGFPVAEATGNATADDAVYVTDGNAVQGVTVSITGLTATWRASDTANWFRH